MECIAESDVLIVISDASCGVYNSPQLCIMASTIGQVQRAIFIEGGRFDRSSTHFSKQVYIIVYHKTNTTEMLY
jgi:hypothetical protein